MSKEDVVFRLSLLEISKMQICKNAKMHSIKSTFSHRQLFDPGGIIQTVDYIVGKLESVDKRAFGTRFERQD